MSDDTFRFETRAIHAGQDPDAPYGSVNVPIYQTATYVQPAVGEPKVWDYARGGNPTREAFQQALAALEGAERGFAFSSGLGAETTLLLTLRPGDHVVLADDVYGGTYRLLSSVLSSWGLTFTTVDLGDQAALVDALGPMTKLVWIETPSNPLLKIVDIGAVAATAHAAGRAGGGGQHVRHPGAAATAGSGSRRRGAQRHEVHRRPLRSDRRGDRHQRRGVDRTARVPDERDRRGARADGLLPRPARPEDPGDPHAGALLGCPRDRRVPADPPRRLGRVLPGAVRPRGPCDRDPADGRLRRDGVVPRGVGRPRGGPRRADRALLPGRIPRRSGIADRGAGAR